MGCSTTQVPPQWATNMRTSTSRATCKLPAATQAWVTSPNGTILDLRVLDLLIHTHVLHTGAAINRQPAFKRRTTARVDLSRSSRRHASRLLYHAVAAGWRVKTT